jgi:hypothetical protein
VRFAVDGLRPARSTVRLLLPCAAVLALAAAAPNRAPIWLTGLAAYTFAVGVFTSGGRSNRFWTFAVLCLLAMGAAGHVVHGENLRRAHELLQDGADPR